MYYINVFVKQRLIPVILAALLVLGLAACGNKQETDTAAWVYVPEYLDLEDGDRINWYDARFAGDDFYYVSYDWDMESGTNSMSLIRYSVPEGSTERTALSLPGEAGMNCWTIGNDGSLYAVLAIWNWNENTGISDNTYMLAKYDGQGNELFVNDFTNLLDSEDYLSGIVTDGEDRIYVSGQSAIWLFDANGQPAGNINLNFGMGGWVNSICRGADGRIYAAVSGSNGTALWTVDFEKKSLEDSYSDFPSAEAICQNAEGNFLLHDRTSVYMYDVKSQKKEKLFDWLDCDINGNYVRGFAVLSDGRIVAAFDDWQSKDSGMVALNRVKAGEVVQKQRIVLGMLYQDSEMEAAIVNFNKSNDTYHVTVRQYIDYDSWSDTTVSDALARMNSDITSGNCPDILCLEGVNVKQLAAKGVFEDLNPYLDQSSMDRSDMLDNVLDAYTYDGRLICILDRFNVETVVGSRSQVGEEMGWTLDELIAFANAHPDAELFDWMPKEEIFHFCLTYNIDTYVDWKTGKCHFDSEEFKSLLKFVGSFPSYEEMTYEEGRPSMPKRIQNGEVLLAEARFSELDEMQLYMEIFGGDVTCIGYPNTDGGSGAVLTPNGAYAIMASSKVKEGAWAFLESYLTRESNFHSWGFPNSKSQLESMADKAVNVVYILDENGEPMLDAHGNPMAEGVGSKGWGWGDWEYYFRIPTREEVDMVLQLINSASIGSESSEQIMAIINEEAAAFFQGQKSVDDVAATIQSRVKVYVDENR